MSGGEVPMENITPYEENDARWCYVAGRPDACVKVAVLLTLTILTGFIIVIRIFQHHYYRDRNYHQYVVYYIALVIILLCIIHWGYVRSAIFDFVNTYLMVVQLLVISYFFCWWASRTLSQERIFNLIVIPVLAVALVYFTAIVFWASLTIQEASHECTHPQWLLFTSSQLVMVQLFLIAVVYISRKLNNVRTSRTNRLSQKAQLWGLTVVYEIVSVTTFAYDLYYLSTKDEDSDCATMFTSNSVGITAIYLIHKVLKYFLPQWAICVIFSPTRRRPAEDEVEETIPWTHDPNYQSTFYQPSQEEEEEEKEPLIPYPINHSHATTPYSSYPILPRSTPLTPHSFPWLRTSENPVQSISMTNGMQTFQGFQSQPVVSSRSQSVQT